MRIQELLEGNIGKFQVNKNGILLTRMGPINAQKQHHASDPNADYKPPSGITRGMWAFPWPFFEMFYAIHQVYKALPKKFKNSSFPAIPNDIESPEEREKLRVQQDIWYKERDAEYKKQLELRKPRNFWWNGPLYSRIGPPEKKYDDNWYYWTSPREFAEYAVRDMPIYKLDTGPKFDGNRSVGITRYSKDHLELFLPMQAKPKI